MRIYELLDCENCGAVKAVPAIINYGEITVVDECPVCGYIGLTKDNVPGPERIEIDVEEEIDFQAEFYALVDEYLFDLIDQELDDFVDLIQVIELKNAL